MIVDRVEKKKVLKSPTGQNDQCMDLMCFPPSCGEEKILLWIKGTCCGFACVQSLEQKPG